MKLLIIIAVATASLFVAGCEKKIVEENNGLLGKWKWVKSVGGITGTDIKTPLPGKFKILYFIDGTHYIIDEGQDNFIRMRYTLQPSINILTGATVQGITFYNENEQPSIPQFYVIENTNMSAVHALVITDNVADGYVHFFARIND